MSTFTAYLDDLGSFSNKKEGYAPLPFGYE